MAYLLLQLNRKTEMFLTNSLNKILQENNYLEK